MNNYAKSVYSQKWKGYFAHRTRDVASIQNMQEFEEEQELKLYKEFVVKGLIDIGYPIVAKNEKFVDRFAEYMYRLVTQKDCDFDWCFNTGEYGGFRECYSDCVDIVAGEDDQS